MNSELKRNGRITILYQKADKGEFTKNGKFGYVLLVAEAMKIGISKSTAESYADVVISRLKKTGKIHA